MRVHETSAARSLLPALRARARVLLVRLDNIGDVILLGPAVAAIREALPEAQLTLLASPAGAQGAALLPEIDEVIEHRASWQQLVPGTVAPEADRALIERLREERYDAAIIFTSFSQTSVAPAVACYLADIPVRAAYAPDAFAGEVISHPVPSEGVPAHQAERNLHLVRALGFEGGDGRPRIVVPPEASERASRLLAAAGIEDGAPFVVLVPGASAPARRYARERFAQVARDTVARGLPVVVLGGPHEEALGGELEAEAGAFGVVSVAGRTSVPLMAAVIARAALVIANNSLALHVADALGVPVVSTYAGTDPWSYWEPRATPHQLLTKAVECSPCFGIECDRGHGCMDIEPHEVLVAAEALLAPVGALLTAQADSVGRNSR